VSVVIAATAPLAAQKREVPRVARERAGSPAEIQRMFDAYALLQAQDQLKISDDQYSQFLPRFKALQDERRKAIMERGRIVQEIRRALDDAFDESQVRERLRMLDELETRSAIELKKSYDAIDQILDVRQRARFRLFEDLMERRKLELVSRARLPKRPVQ
jgi:hypothetical protein